MTSRHRSHLVLAAAAAAALAAGLTAPTAFASAESVSGIVTAAATGSPLAGVCVEAFSRQSGKSVTTTTDTGGRYTVVLPEGAGLYFVSFNTCAPAVTAYAVQYWRGTTGQHLATNISVGTGQAVTGIDAALQPASRIVGTVTDAATGSPLPGICVDATDWDAYVFAWAPVTDASGQFVVSTAGAKGGGLPAGAYFITYYDCRQQPEYLMEHYRDRTQYQTGDELPVAVGGTSNADAALTRGGSIAGTLTFAHTGQPALTSVSVFRPGTSGGAPTPVGPDGTAVMTGQPGPSGPQRPPVYAGRLGVFHFAPLPAGDYLVLYSGPGVVDEWYDDSPTATGAKVLHLNVGDHLSADAVVTPAPSGALACEDNPPPPASMRFDDVSDSSPHASSIACLASLGVVTGTSRHTYSPDAAVSRAQFASFVAASLRQLGVTLPETPPDAFADDNGSVHELAINQLAALGVVKGTAPRVYSPSLSVTRGQAAVTLVRAYVAATRLQLRAGTDRFTDDNGSVFESAINQAALAAIVQGTSATTFAPTRLLSRAQAATLFDQLLGRAGRDIVAATVPTTGPTP